LHVNFLHISFKIEHIVTIKYKVFFDVDSIQNLINMNKPRLLDAILHSFLLLNHCRDFSAVFRQQIVNNVKRIRSWRFRGYYKLLFDFRECMINVLVFHDFFVLALQIPIEYGLFLRNKLFDPLNFLTFVTDAGH